MKQLYFLFFGLFLFQLSFGQIGFLDNVIIEGEPELYNPLDIKSGDIDGDGNMDVIVSASGTIAWYKNEDGLGYFGSQQIISESIIYPRSIFAVDLDGDGDVDIVAATGSANKIVWFENINGLGTFGNEQQISSNANNASSVFVTDIDGDGDNDVVSASSGDDKIAWYENLNGQGAFGPQQIISVSANGARSVITSDVDGDSDMDVLSISYSDNKVAWYENLDGLGTFGPQQIITSNAEQPISLFSGDFDGDNDMDVLFASNYNNKIIWYENTDGLGNFQFKELIESTNISGLSGIYASDIDGDGDLDVLSSSANDDRIAWYENTDGAGSFGNQQVITTFADGARSVYSVDLDGDNDMDVLSVSSSNGEINWYENTNSLGDFRIGEKIPTVPNTVRSTYSIDIDGDGDVDVLSASYVDDRIAWYENIDGLGNFGVQRTISTAVNGALFVYADDVDGDGDIDVLSAAGLDHTISWYENIDGLGNFGLEKVISNIALGVKAIHSNDIDGDGDIDVIGASSTTDEVVWYKNTDGFGDVWSEQIITNTADFANSVYSIDLDNDGDIDVLSTSISDNKIAWYENTNAQGVFGPQQIISTNHNNPIRVIASDIDNDGDNDVVAASRVDNKIAWYENIDSQGTFGSQQIITTEAIYVRDIEIADLNNDGNQDVISGTSFTGLFWYENINGLGSFGVKQFIGTNNAILPNSIDSNDIDGDGKIDVIYTDENHDKVAWYKNQGPAYNEISGLVQIDLNNNGCDASDNPAYTFLVNTTNGTNNYSNFTLTNGLYQNFPGQGNFITQVENLPSYYSSNPLSHTSNFTSIGNTESVNFCLQANSSVNDLNITIYPSNNEPRPGFDTTYHLVYNNIGTTQLSGSVSFEFNDSKLNFLNASETGTSQTANTLNFDFTDLNPFETRTIDLQFNVFAPPTTNINDILTSTATINPITGDNTEEDNTFSLNQTVIGSYDPNDTTCLEGDEILLEDADKYLHYLIRFQNTGTASAINVRVENVLDDKLNWTTMQLESLSHVGRVEILNGSEVSFIFDNINLADSTNDEPNSHGFIAYKIKPLDNVIVGDIFYNTADIFFDFNPPITTNTAATEIVNTLSINDYDVSRLEYFPNPVQDILRLKYSSNIESVEITDILGNRVYSNEFNASEIELDLSELATSMYFVTIKSENNQMVIKILKE